VARLQGVYRWWLARTTRIRTARAPLIAALFLAVALLAALWQIDGILRAIHRPGDAAYGIGALSDPGMPPPESGRAGHVTAAWSAGRVRGFTGPDTLAYWYVALDVLFIVAYSWILVVVLAGIRERLRDDTTEATFATAAERHAASGAAARSVTAEAQRIGRLAARYARLMGLASAGVVVLALVDLLEDALQVYAVAHCVRDNAPHDCVEWQLTWALYLVTTLKWLLSAAVLVPALLGVFVLASLHRRQARELARVLVRVRAPLAVVLLLGFAYLVKASPFADQAADLLRRWKDEWWQGVIGALLTALLAAVILSFARWLVAVERKAAADPAGALWIATAVAVVLGGVAAVWPGGTGLLVLAGLLLAIAVLSALAGTVDDDPPPSAADAYGATAVPALLAAAPLVALGLAVQGAALGEIAWAGNAGYVVWLVVGLVLQALGWGAYFWARPAHAVSGLLAGLGGLVVVVVAV
jgi:hypothetical protein